ncbi:PAAR domain-containing protein [Agromyces sp. M3QZ16-3]|uniref:hypothetical protein n=1 Tax=Agromyces sp. M3QZ16-3 TaxID=3447585 RepID=UPI003F69085C
MSEPIVDAGTQVRCPHGGAGTTASVEPRVRVAGRPVATVATAWSVSGCRGEGVRGCVAARALGGSSRVAAGGAPLVRVTDPIVGEPSGAVVSVVVWTDRVRIA